MSLRVLISALLLALPVPAIAQEAVASTTLYSEPVWPFEASDIPVDPAFHFGVLDNGMRYILRETAPIGFPKARW